MRALRTYMWLNLRRSVALKDLVTLILRSQTGELRTAAMVVKARTRLQLARGAKTKFGSTQWKQANQSSTYVSMSRLKLLHHDADHLSSPFM